MYSTSAPQASAESGLGAGGSSGSGSGSGPDAQGLEALEPSAVVREVCSWLSARACELEAGGVPRWSLVVDPGLGFSKRPVHSFALLGAGAKGFAPAGYPVLVGASRKGFLGAASGVEDPRERAWGTAAAVTASVGGGCDLVRVHDVAEMVQVCRVADAIYRGYAGPCAGGKA